jgi:hypothetical protein
VTAVAFAASVARGRTIDYSTLLGQLDQHVAEGGRALASAELQRIIEARAATAIDGYDLISGLAGTARYLLERSAEDPESKAALCEAVALRGGDVKGVIFHSDRGSEYTADLFEGLGAKLGIIQSMGRVGSALDKRGVQEFLLDAGVRAAEEEALRHQGRGPPRSGPATSTATTGCGVTAPVR